MRKLIYVIIILSLIIALGIYDTIKVSSVLNTIQNNLNYVSNNINAENLTTNYAKIKSINDYWIVEEKKLCVLFNHKDLNTLSLGFNRLLTYIEQDDYENSELELNQLIQESQNFYHIMGFNMVNIL